MISMTIPQYCRHECTINGFAVKLRPQAAEVLSILLVSDPNEFVAQSELIEFVWPDPDSQPDYADTLLGKMFTILRQSGVAIENDWGRGWRIPRWAREQVHVAEAA
jgi:DNA-binding winged helix-turn-helix (wHTH) protein